MNAEAITNAIRGVILGELGEVRTVPPGAWIEGQPAQLGLHGGLDGDSARRLRASGKRLFDVELAPSQRTGGLGSPAAAQAHVEVLPRVVLWVPITIVADTVSAKHRYAARADALAQARTIADALGWPGNLDRDADGTPTGLVSGLLREAGPPRIVREDWSVGLYEVELRFRGLVKVTRAIVDPPAFVRAPTIYVAGAEEAAVGGTLIADPGEAVRASSLTGQWLRDGGALPGETAVRYEVVEDDGGSALSYRSTATGPGGVVSADSPAIVVAGDAPWDPSQLAGYAFDYDGESYSGGTLLDISGNGRDLSQADVAKRPTQVSRNGRLALEFGGAQWLRGVFEASLSHPLTLYVVAEQTSLLGSQFFWDGDAPAGRCAFSSTATALEMNSGAPLAGPSNDAATQHAHSCVFNGSSSEMYALSDFSTPGALGPAGTRALSGLTMGAAYTEGFRLTGFIWRVIGYIAAHDAPTRKLMGDYLSARYSIPIVT